MFCPRTKARGIVRGDLLWSKQHGSTATKDTVYSCVLMSHSSLVHSTFCIELGTLLDKPTLRSLANPDKHSIHCVVDVPECVASGYQVLFKPNGYKQGDDYIQDVKLDSAGNDLVVAAARKAGVCGTCAGTGTQVQGYSATVIGYLNSGAIPGSNPKSTGKGDPPILRVTKVLPFATPCPPAPSPAPAPGTICFSGDMSLEVQNEGPRKIKHLQLGDKVKTSSDPDIFEPVYSFGHRDVNSFGEFVQITTQSATLELSKDHMVFVGGSGSLPASRIKVGDKLDNGALVEKVTIVVRKGIYAPFTPSGTIMVNGIKASTYVAFQDSPVLKVGSFQTPLSYQWMAHASQFPHRIYCHYFGPCVTESYNEEGISVWVARPLEMALWVLSCSPVMLVALLIPLCALLCSFCVLDMILIHCPMLSASVSLTAWYIWTRVLSKKLKQV